MAGWHLPPFPPWPPDDGQAGQSTPAPDSRRQLLAIYMEKKQTFTGCKKMDTLPEKINPF